MFYDERIENVKGKIARKALIISLFLSLILGGIHLANIIKNASDPICFWFASLEIAVFAGTLVALTIGFIRSRLYTKDERTEGAQNMYYNKAASVLIKLILGVFAFALPITLSIYIPFNFADRGLDSILPVLLFVIGIYVVYSFKRNDIYFNYSIMESGHYYSEVFKTIGKFALFALILFCISTLSLMGLIAIKTPEQALLPRILFQTAGYYIVTLAELSALYLLYSFLEKCSYKKETSISNSTVTSLCITIAIYAVYTAGVIFVDTLPFSQSDAMQIVSVLSGFDIYIKFALLIFLTYFGYEYQRVRQNRKISIACAVLLFSETLAVFLEHVSGGLSLVFLPELASGEAYWITQLFATINVLIEDASSVANVVGIILILFALIEDNLIHRAHRFAVGIFAILGGIELFLRTQVPYLHVTIYHFMAELVVLCYIAALVISISKKINAQYSSSFCDL